MPNLLKNPDSEAVKRIPEVSRGAVPPASNSWRLLHKGRIIPFPKGYADQPYFIRTDDGALVMICTISPGQQEGRLGQHVVSIRSDDYGKSCSTPVALESSLDTESSYAVILKTPGGRLYTFYNHNTDNIRRVVGDPAAYPDGWCTRVDSLGYFVCKYSDDHGRTWSEKRHTIPVREFEIDRENTSNGKIRYFWNVGKAFWLGDVAYVPLHKVGGFGVDFFTRSEGALIRIPNLATEMDPEKLLFETLPEGDVGIRAPEGAGPIGEEHSFVVLSDGSIFTVFRTVSGYAACSYSRDGGKSWSESDYLRYPDGRRVKNPRAANFIWRLSDNRYLYWFHNHSGTSYSDRNPVWCLAAREMEGKQGLELEFSQPEILLYSDDITQRMSYPDCMELSDGSLLLTETEKQNCRLHEIPAGFVAAVCNQWAQPPCPREEDLLLDWQGNGDANPEKVDVNFPTMYDREGGWECISGQDLRTGFTLVMEIGKGWKPGQLLDNKTSRGRGLAVTIREGGLLEISLSDGRSESRWHFMQQLQVGKACHVTLIVDGGPKIISALFDGVFDDGGERQFGFGLFHPFLQSVNGLPELSISACLDRLMIYRRALLSAEAVALFKQRSKPAMA